MKCNVGGIDMAVRITLGIALGVVAYVVPMAVVWQSLLYVVAAIALVTGLIRFCPINSMFGINTCAQKEQKQSGAH